LIKNIKFSFSASIRDSSCVQTINDHRSIFNPPETLQLTQMPASNTETVGDKRSLSSPQGSASSSPTRSASSGSSTSSLSEGPDREADDDDLEKSFKTMDLYENEGSFQTSLPLPPQPSPIPPVSPKLGSHISQIVSGNCNHI
jgi:hypothetical protein